MADAIFVLKWEIAHHGNCRYSIKNVRFQTDVGSSRTSHKDGEVVQISAKDELWWIEDGPGDQYRYVLTLSVPAHRLKLGMSKAFNMTQRTDAGVLMTGQTAQW